MKKIKLFVLTLCSFMLLQNAVFAQEDSQNLPKRQYILDSLNEVQECTAIALSENFGTVFVYDNNSFYYSHIPMEMYNKLILTSSKNLVLRDMNISDNGLWYILADEIEFCQEMYPEVIEHARELQAAGQKILSISFNDYNRWCVLSENRFYCSDTELYDFIMENYERYGDVQYVHITNENVVISCKTGINWTNTISQRFYDELVNLSFNPTVIKYFPDESYCILAPNEKKFEIWLQQ